MAETNENKSIDPNTALALGTLILDILTTYALPLAIKIIHTITSTEDVTIAQILDLKKKVPSIEELEAAAGIHFE